MADKKPKPKVKPKPVQRVPAVQATGRPTLLNQARHDAIVNATKLGAPFKQACGYAGVGVSTALAWMARGRVERDRIDRLRQVILADPDIQDDEIESICRPLDSEAIYLEFSDSVEKARGEQVITDLAAIAKAAKEGSWQAAAWRLERKYPQEFARRTVVEGGDKPVQLDQTVTGHVDVAHRVADPEAAKLAHQLLERLASPEGDAE